MKSIEEVIRDGFEPLHMETDLASITHRNAPAATRRKPIALLVSGVAIVGVIGAVLFGTLRAPSAEAMWAPVPSSPDQELVASASDLCSAVFPADVLPLPPLVLIDQRANAARAVFGEVGETFQRFSVCTLVKTGGAWTAPPLDALPFEAKTIAGAVDSYATEVAAVVIDQVDGVRVQAALGEGFFHFWWISPDDFPGGTLRVLDIDGGILDSAEIPARTTG
ncbi:MAG: hypothetical protein WD652_05415 [Acidimicrobiia bacterium]